MAGDGTNAMDWHPERRLYEPLVCFQNRMAETTTVQMDEEGRVTVPKPTRELLGVESEKAILRLNIEVREVLTNE